MLNSKQKWSRRKFMTAVSTTGAAIVLQPFLSLANSNEADPRLARIVAESPGIDTHNHIDVPLEKAELPGPRLDLPGELKRAGLSVIVMTFATDYKKDIQPGEAYQRFLNGTEAMDKVLVDNGIKRALNLADVKTAHKNHQQTVIQSVEGCHFLEGRLERVEEAYRRGLRHLAYCTIVTLLCHWVMYILTRRNLADLRVSAHE